MRRGRHHAAKPAADEQVLGQQGRPNARPPATAAVRSAAPNRTQSSAVLTSRGFRATVLPGRRLRGWSCQRATASNRRSRGKECCGSQSGGQRGGASSEGTTGAGASRPAGRFAPALSPGPGAVCQVVQLDPAHRHTRGADSDNWLTAGSAGNGSYSYYMAQRVQAAAS